MSVSQRSYRGADRGGREQPARARTTGMDWAAAADAADREEVSQPAPPAAPGGGSVGGSMDPSSSPSPSSGGPGQQRDASQMNRYARGGGGMPGAGSPS